MSHPGFLQLVDQLCATSRRVVETPADYPKEPDLLAELGRCAALLDLVAIVLEREHVNVSLLCSTRARLIRGKIAIARGT